VVTVKPRGTCRSVRASSGGCPARWWRTSRKGVTEGFKRELELVGVGYRAAMQGKDLKLSLGYSHEVIFEVPAGVSVATPKPTEIVIEGIDQQLVGQVAANIRDWRRPEPYKGKGIRYKGEYIFRKEGKKK
jgi:large subunit ribosomal protein L6